MGRSPDPNGQPRRPLDELGRIDLEAMTQRSTRAHGGLLIQITTNLSLTMRGWRPERAHTLMPPRPATSP